MTKSQDDGENALAEYRAKRDLEKSPEPTGDAPDDKGGKQGGKTYVIQKHDASRLHYDFRLELDGVLKSWAVTKGPSLDPSEKRLAVMVEDHPLDYGDFEGVIPEGYGAGTVMLWDEGTWEPQEDPREGLAEGELKFVLHGKRLKGGFALVRMKGKSSGGKENWLLIKERDDQADEETDPRRKWTDSVHSGRDMETIAKQGKAWEGADNDKNSGGNRQDPDPPSFVEPQLAKLKKRPPSGEEWLHEPKYDGYRIEAILNGGDISLVTRNEKDWTDRYPSIANALSGLAVESAILDGELVAIDRHGHSDFSTLQNAASNDNIELRYYAFDLLHWNGEDLREEPLKERKKRLSKLLKDVEEPLFYGEHTEGDGQKVLDDACDDGLEGIVSKNADAAYRSGRGTDWIKTKCTGSDEFVVVGYRESDKEGRPFASLLLAEYDGDDLIYRGRVGTGFDSEAFDELQSKMKRLERKTSPLASTPGDARNRAVWLTPKLVAQIAYTERTDDGMLRHPSFLGLREDKDAEEVQVPDG